MASAVSVSELQRNAKSIIDECVSTGRAKRITRHRESPVILVKTERYLELLKMELVTKERDFMVKRSLIEEIDDIDVLESLLFEQFSEDTQ